MKEKVLLNSVYHRVAECLRALAHPKRLQLLRVMAGGRYTVGELAGSLKVVSHAASEHLRLLERCGFVRCEREGPCRYYRIADPYVLELLSCMESRCGTSEK